MPLQWLPLDLSRYDRLKPRTAISEALTPGVRRTAGTTMGGMPARKGFMERMREDQALEAERKYQEKMMKLQHEQEMEKAKFAAGLEEDTRKGTTPITTGQALGREPAEPATPELTKENMPEAATEVWKFISTLEPESQKFFIQQLKQKEQPTGYVEAAGKRVEVPGSVGMYGYLVDQGLIDPATDTVIEKKPEVMKGRYEIVEKGGKVYKYDTTTGEETILGTTDKPEMTIAEIDKQANADAVAKTKLDPTTNFEDNKNDSLVDLGVDEEVAKDWAKVKKMPKDKKTPLHTRIINWFKNIGKMPKGWAPKGAGVPGVGEGAFNETNVNSLVPVISDDVTEAERAHLKGQGASDRDIDEAIRRKAGE